MKHLKSYEQSIENDHTKTPLIGNYIICDDNCEDNLTKFLKTNIGKIIKIYNSDNNLETHYHAIYNNIPKNLKPYFQFMNLNNCRLIDPEEIKYWSPNKKDLIHYIITNKYNL